MAKKEAKARKKYIVRYIKKNVEEFHGGAWKVAYAGFVTAMMAFFLLLWLIAASTPQKKKQLVKFFTHYSLTGSEGILVGMGKAPVLFSDPSYSIETQIKRVSDEVATQIKNKLSTYEGVSLERTDDGDIKLQLSNTNNKEEDIFVPEKDELSEKGKKIIASVSEIIKNTNLQISIEGHMDSSPFAKGNNITNWELSAFRASKARRAFQEQGIDESRFDKIVGYADKRLQYKENPLDVRNNRLKVVLTSPVPQVVEAPPVEKAKGIEMPKLSNFIDLLRGLGKGNEVKEDSSNNPVPREPKRNQEGKNGEGR